jgi:raffinose/stachyose/melibiose transport system substrate-binding protein
MPTPPMEEGGTAAAIGTFGEPWHIVASTEHPDVAAAYLDFITGEQAQRRFQESGIIPAALLPEAGGSGGLLASSVQAWNSLGEANALTAYLDWSTPNMGNVLDPGIQELMAGKTTPEELLA